MEKKPLKTDAHWQEKLTSEQYRVARKNGTEPAFSGTYYNHHACGVYHCIACDAALFRSNEKYDSGSGWPSYWAPINEQAITLITDNSHGMARTEVRCARCNSHLGHVFKDGPVPTGLRYCINSVVLDFEDTFENTTD